MGAGGPHVGPVAPTFRIITEGGPTTSTWNGSERTQARSNIEASRNEGSKEAKKNDPARPVNEHIESMEKMTRSLNE